MAKVVIFGSGRGADVAFRHLTRDSKHEICGFTVDRKYLVQETFHELPLVPFDEVERSFPPDKFHLFALLGYQEMNGLRARAYTEGKQRGYRFISYICSDLFHVEDIDVGENCFILDNQSINLDVTIGNNVVMWSSNHVGDLSVIDDHVWISSHVTIAANVTIKQNSFIGVGATILNHVVVAPNTIVGANTLVSEDTRENGVYVCGKPGCFSEDSRNFMKVSEAMGKL